MASSMEAATIGYFTTVESERTGWTGGLLVLNSAGRPLEFQCTLPIRPTRSHEILFGSTLREHLIAEVIGPTLLQKCRTPISLLCCQQIEALALQENLSANTNRLTGTTGSSLPTVVGLVEDLVGGLVGESDGPSATNSLRGHESLEIANASILVAMEQVEAARQAIAKLSDLMDTTEPFERIIEAIREAQSQLAKSQAPMSQNPMSQNPMSQAPANQTTASQTTAKVA